MSSRPEISVIVPVRNGADALPNLLRSLAAQTLSPDRYEVIVVDNDSSDDTAQVARAAGAIVVTEPVANRSLARNRGAAVARSPLYAFTDADCVADPVWLEAFLRCAPKAPLVAGDVQVSVRDRPNAIERFERIWRFGQRWWVQQGWAATANLLIDAEAFRAIGEFDPSWRVAAEDVDFCIRARAQGFALEFCEEAVVRHYGERTFGPFLRRCFNHGYGSNQAFYRYGIAWRAWREPKPAFVGDNALRRIGQQPEGFSSGEWRRMAQMARIAYAARIAGSLWAEVQRAR